MLAAAREAFGAALDDDLNVSAGLAAVFDLVRDLNRRIEARSLSTADAAAAIATLRDVDQVLGILPDEATTSFGGCVHTARCTGRRLEPPATGPPRTACAMNSLTLGIVVEDTRDGQRWRRASEVDHG